jgi:hypothetical protein
MVFSDCHVVKPLQTDPASSRPSLGGDGIVVVAFLRVSASDAKALAAASASKSCGR